VYEVEFLAVGDGEKSGEAIALRFTSPIDGGTVVGVIDAGFTDTGPELVSHIIRHYGSDWVDFVLSTHPDADHINGMGYVMRNLRVGNLLIHRPAQHGYSNNSGARPAEELVRLAEAQGSNVMEPFAGVNGWGDAFLIAGPTREHYERMLADQEETAKAEARRLSFAERYFGESAVKTVRALAERVLANFPVEIPFDDAGGTNPRNNSSAILSLMVDGKHLLFPSDAGVPAINQAMDFLDGRGRTTLYPAFFGLPHHGSRHNLDLDTIQRILGSHTNEHYGTAFVSVSAESDLPSPRVANAAGRRGYRVYKTDGSGYIRHSSPDAPYRAGLQPLTPLPPLVEDDHDA
jgi:beta-lactamase superfamily II metal-dependent hydrolase